MGDPLEPLEPIERWILAVTAVVFGLIMFNLVVAEKANAFTRPAPTRVTVKHHQANTHQRRMIARVLHQCDTMRSSRKVLIASIATITQESTATNLTGGDLDSVGLFQIRAMHGTYAQRHSPEWSAAWFCSRAKNIDHHRPHYTVAQLSQAVQRSCCPSAYGRWTREAVRTYRLTLRRA